jgi:hypothetical protein
MALHRLATLLVSLIFQACRRTGHHCPSWVHIAFNNISFGSKACAKCKAWTLVDTRWYLHLLLSLLALLPEEYPVECSRLSAEIVVSYQEVWDHPRLSLEDCWNLRKSTLTKQAVLPLPFPRPPRKVRRSLFSQRAHRFRHFSIYIMCEMVIEIVSTQGTSEYGLMHGLQELQFKSSPQATAFRQLFPRLPNYCPQPTVLICLVWQLRRQVWAVSSSGAPKMLRARWRLPASRNCRNTCV